MKGVLLINLGTPEAPTAQAVRRYLGAFLSDRRVIQMNPIFWQPILHGMIMPFRGPRSAKLYQKIWTDEGSPLLTITKAQAEQLQTLLPEQRVRFAMSYSQPSIENELTAMTQAGVDDLTILPAYPQYSTTTVASVLDSVHRFYLHQQSSPTLHLISSYCHEPAYLDALANNIKNQLEKHPVEHLVFSYHGIPESYAQQGDPYAKECTDTTAGVVARLNPTVQVSQSYQSQFGPSQWLQPSTHQTLVDLAQGGTRSVAVITPSFIADCLETISEIGIENRGYFEDAGGTELVRIKPVNEDPAFVSALRDIVVVNQRR